MYIQNSPYLSAVQMPGKQQAVASSAAENAHKTGFEEILRKAEQNSSTQLKFSKHAANRLAERNINLSSGQLDRLCQGAEKASGKGLKEPLVLIDDLAFIVSTGNRTVITAMESAGTEENIFTNIDGAVIN